MTLNLGYLSQGKLYLKLGPAPAQAITSQFGQTVQERVQQIQRRNAWKNRSIMAGFLPPELLKQNNNEQAAKVPVLIKSLCKGRDGTLFYSLEAGSVAGIFLLNQLAAESGPNEQRLFHNADFQVHYLDFHPAHNLIACTVMHRNGVGNIATMPADGIKPKEITEGDSIDLAPRWVPGKGKTLVFQSAGIGRDREGYAWEQGPFTIEQLNFDRQEVTSLAADPKYDFLGPQVSPDGTLYYIRRPYKSQQRRGQWWTVIRDILLMPFWLLYAIFQWLNFFTFRYTGKPLTIAGQPKSSELNQLTAWGNLIDVDKAMKQHRFGDADAPSLVPRTWQLVSQAPDGTTTTLAEGVLAFDLSKDGNIVYTNGSAIYRIEPGGLPERLVLGKLIEQVTIID